ncbi:MAG: hypothetical protein ABR999_05465 [Methanoregula sp.]|jgi:hypothetical protein|uniref:hypothetical protein n=1 Tax=Methanoregula sp. TaxID=2052170 RepID=UPI003D14AEBA
MIMAGGTPFPFCPLSRGSPPSHVAERVGGTPKRRESAHLSRQDLRLIYRSTQYDDNIKTWMMFGDDYEQSTTIENLELSKRLDKLVFGFLSGENN